MPTQDSSTNQASATKQEELHIFNELREMFLKTKTLPQSIKPKQGALTRYLFSRKTRPDDVIQSDKLTQDQHLSLNLARKLQALKDIEKSPTKVLYAVVNLWDGPYHPKWAV